MRNSSLKAVPLLLLLGVLISAFMLGLKQITDVDALLHLALGKFLVTTKEFPQFEPFCYPAAETPFLYTSWLFAVSCFLLFKLSGGAVLLSVTIAGCVVLLAYCLYRDAHLLSGEQHHVLAALAVGAGLLLAEDRFVPRPELLLYLFFATQVWLLGRWIFTGERRGLWFLPLVALLWGNIHSSVILIVVPFAAFAAYLGVEVVRPEDAAARGRALCKLKSLALLAGLSLLAALCNPNGIGQFQYGQNVMGSDWYRQSISELMPPRTKELWIIWPVFAASLVISVLALRRRAIPYLLISVAVLCLGLTAVRFFAFFCLVQAPIVGRGLVILCQRWQGVLRHSATTVITALCLLGLAVLKAGSFYPLQRDVISTERFGVGYAVPIDHEAAVDYLRANGIKGRVFNVFEDGQAISWYGWPELTVFIDGRGVLPPDLLEDYKNALDRAVMTKLQQRFGFEVIVLRRYANFQFNPHGASGLFVNYEWAMVYSDRESYVFLRKGGPYQKVIDRDEYKYLVANADFQTYQEIFKQKTDYYKGLMNELLRLPDSQRGDFDRILLGYCYYLDGASERALEIIGPHRNSSGFSLFLYGKILQAQGRHREAAEVFLDGVKRFRSQDFQQELAQSQALARELK